MVCDRNPVELAFPASLINIATSVTGPTNINAGQADGQKVVKIRPDFILGKETGCKCGNKSRNEDIHLDTASVSETSDLQI